MAERERGFSLLEALIATALMLAVTAAAFTVMHPAHGAFAVEPEAADVQQRLRVAADTLSRDLTMAGAGAYQGPHAGSLVYLFPAVLPFRQGAAHDEPPGAFASDRITVIYVPSTPAQSTLTEPLTGPTARFSTGAETGCPIDPGSSTEATRCGFARDQTVLVYDATGSYNLFTIAALFAGEATLTAKKPGGAGNTFPAGSRIVEAENHTYYLKSDDSTGTYQLMHYDGTSNAEVPVVDHIVALRFEYYGEGQPPILLRPIGDAEEPSTTYGPKPVAGVAGCIFSAASPPAPLLPALGDGSQRLVALTEAMLTDGPFCPDDGNPNRWDADLLRIRRIGVTLRVQSAAAALRGAAGALFAHPGTAQSSAKWVPDQEIHFDVSPRNLNLAR
jgi:hypothetical protein